MRRKEVGFDVWIGNVCVCVCPHALVVFVCQSSLTVLRIASWISFMW